MGSLERQGARTADRSEEVIACETSLSITYSLGTSFAELFDFASLEKSTFAIFIMETTSSVVESGVHLLTYELISGDLLRQIEHATSVVNTSTDELGEFYAMAICIDYYCENGGEEMLLMNYE